MRLPLPCLAPLFLLALLSSPAVRADDTPQFNFVRGEITKVDGNTISVGQQQITTNDKTQYVHGTDPYTDGLKVGQKITARCDAQGIALRIEVH